MKSRYLPVCLFNILFAMYLAGCAGEAFKIAQEDNTIAAYEQFLREYGDSEFAPQAKKSGLGVKDQGFQGLGVKSTIDLYYQFR